MTDCIPFFPVSCLGFFVPAVLAISVALLLLYRPFILPVIYTLRTSLPQSLLHFCSPVPEDLHGRIVLLKKCMENVQDINGVRNWDLEE
jgi:hypothetical protein